MTPSWLAWRFTTCSSRVLWLSLCFTYCTLKWMQCTLWVLFCASSVLQLPSASFSSRRCGQFSSYRFFFFFQSLIRKVFPPPPPPSPLFREASSLKLYLTLCKPLVHHLLIDTFPSLLIATTPTPPPFLPSFSAPPLCHFELGSWPFCYPLSHNSLLFFWCLLIRPRSRPKKKFPLQPHPHPHHFHFPLTLLFGEGEWGWGWGWGCGCGCAWRSMYVKQKEWDCGLDALFALGFGRELYPILLSNYRLA